MTSVLGQYQAAVERFMSNEQRVQDFTNDNVNGYYTTNTPTAEHVETLPHLMRRLQGRYLTIQYKGPWTADTQYAMNDVISGPDNTFWLIVRPYTSGSSFQEDKDAEAFIPYGVELGAAETNFRWPWSATENTASGQILNLPMPYYPHRESLILFYQGAVCAPRKDGVEVAGLYQYEEVGIDPNQLSSQIRVYFPIAIGDALDMFVAASAFSDSMTELRELIEEVTEGIEAAKEAADQAAQSKEDAAAIASEAEERLAQQITAASDTFATKVAEAEAARDQAEESASEAQAAVVESNDILAEIKSLQGAATHLPAHDFGPSSETPAWQAALTTYAMAFFEGKDEPPNAAVVQNLFDTHEWIYNTELKAWTDNGPGAVQIGSNSRVGVVKGTANQFGMVSVLTDGSMKVNGFTDLVVGARQIKTQEAIHVANTDYAVPQYIVSNNKLRVWYNGVRCYPGTNEIIHQYIEIGDAGQPSVLIKFNFDLSIGDTVLAEVN